MADGGGSAADGGGSAADGGGSAADGGGSAADGGGSVADGGGFWRSFKRHVADVKHIAGDEKATLMVDRRPQFVCLR